MQVTIYTRPSCTYCDRAKLFFKNKNIEFTEQRVGDHITNAGYTALTGMTSVPGIFINEKFIGGYTDLVEYAVENPEVF